MRAGPPAARVPRNGTAKVLTLFHPADGQVRIEGVTTCPNAVLHPWLRRELSAVLEGLPEAPAACREPTRRPEPPGSGGRTA